MEILFRDGTGNSNALAVRKKAAPKGAARSAPGKGKLLLLESEVDPATYIAEIETVKLQGHVVPIAVDQAERRGIEVLIHGVEVKRRRIEGLVEGKKPVVNVGPVTWVANGMLGNVPPGKTMFADTPSAPTPTVPLL
jgi:hypothetical protein